MPEQPSYIGRFAPSPTGPLHLGSLSTALAGYLQARSQQGQWLLRIDDLDTPRNAPDASDGILATLDTYGLHWDDEADYQSRHLAEYEHLLHQLQQDGLAYPCTCTRKSLTALHAEPAAGDVYPGLCRNQRHPATSPYSLRIKTDPRIVTFEDQLQGTISHRLAEQHGDFIIKRRDQIIAYQFAVVVDDARQGITEVVRGFDLLQETPKQIFLQQILGFSSPGYRHVPVIVDRDGRKLSKQTLAEAVALTEPETVLFQLLGLLRQRPPDELRGAPPTELLDWAIGHWNPEPLRNSRTIRPENLSNTGSPHSSSHSGHAHVGHQTLPGNP
ncbi:tRNA glutamyl-Q(34) synthetase GluQRS [Methylosarcina fibrata]|uniref:tRNA glutamyl-Q(34) synthetase GluQRS n=1 Tax=Methylosarcina fibrata TaxID=105972 RepID=UPI000364A5DA|nr:tRNA glutamyl-Q(34) synthetase GluQRS [Methylosarcina fibrata]